MTRLNWKECRLRHGFRVSRKLREDSIILRYLASYVLVLGMYLVHQGVTNLVRTLTHKTTQDCRLGRLGHF